MKDKNIFVSMRPSYVNLKNHCYPPFTFKGCDSFFIRVQKYENVGNILNFKNKRYIN